QRYPLCYFSVVACCPHRLCHSYCLPGVAVGYDRRTHSRHAVLDDAGRIAGPVGEQPTGQGHREHPVRHDPGKPDRSSHPIVPMNRIEITGCTGVSHEMLARDPVRLIRDDVTNGKRFCDPFSHPSPPSSSGRTSSVANETQTSPPCSSRTSERTVSKSLPATCRTLSRRVVVWSRSPTV